MSRHAHLNRADLVDCLRVYGLSHLDIWAERLGYAAQPAIPETPVPPEPEVLPSPEAPSSPHTTIVETSLQTQFHRVVAYRTLAPAEGSSTEPEWYQKANPGHENDRDLTANPDLPSPPHLPLMLWSRLWPFLKVALGSSVPTAQPDVPPLVQRLARGEMLQRVPRKRHQGWATTCQVLLDFADPLRPFWADFYALLQRLAPLRGEQGLTVFGFPDGDPAGRCLRWSFVQQTWEEIATYPLPVPGTRVLVLSDLGCQDATGTRRRPWRQLGLRLRHLGVQPVALMPCPQRFWDSTVTQLFFPVCWDRSARPARRLRYYRGQTTAGEQDPQATYLLEVLGAAIRVEPALLRAVRFLLPEVDVGSEAAAWNHPHVQTTPVAFSYDQEEVAHYRQAFAGLEKDLQRQVAELLLAYHAPLSPAIIIEELCILAASGQVRQAEDVGEFLARLVRSVRMQEGNFVEAIRAWIQRVARRQHTTVWQNEHLTALWVAAHAAQLQTKERIIVPEGLDISRVLWLLTQETTPRQYLLRQRGRMLYVETDAPVTTELQAPGSTLSRLSATSYSVQVQYTTAENAGQPLVWQALDQGIALPDTGRLLIQTEHQEVCLESLTLPPWADSIGQDAQGLFLTWADEQRKAYWVPPGLYPLTDRSGQVLGHMSLQGFWCDAAEAAALFQDGLQQPEWAAEYGQDTYGLYADFRVANVTQRMRWMAPGEFCMGSPEEEAERWEDETLHPVLLTRSFWLADTTCTQALWQAVMGNNPSHFKGPERPVDSVSWEHVQEFLRRLHASAPVLELRLPTEAEWEYACRSGTTTPFWFGEQITPEQVNYNGNYPYAGGAQGVHRQETVPVKALPCNGWGLYQMHGNVWEWCHDYRADYTAATAESPAVDPMGPAAGVRRVLRGGSWIDHGWHARSAQRVAYHPGLRVHGSGFRLARGQARQEALEAPGGSGASRARQTERSGVGQARRAPRQRRKK